MNNPGGLRTVIRGRVVSFDRIKGYGFVAPDAGGEDVFIHVNDLHSDKSLLGTGSVVEFRIGEGERGPKATDVTVLQPASGLAPAPVAGADPAGAAPWGLVAPEPGERELTEMLLRVEPELTSRQILEIRRRMLRTVQAGLAGGRA
jgi:cold shock CspA family protein